MKIFTRIMLIIAGVLASVGVICMVVAFAMGLTTHDFWDMVEDGKFSISLEDGKLQIFDFKEKDIIKVDVDEKVEAGSEDGETTTYEIKETCKNMDIEFGAGILDIYYDDVEYIQVQETNIAGFKVDVKNDTLVIGGGTELEIGIHDVDNRSLKIIIPSEMKFQEVDLEIGASQADIKNIIAEELSITVGAGQATVTRLSVDKLNVEAGVGEVNIALNGVQEEYNYKVECGIGNVVVGNASYGGLGAEQTVKNEGATKEIDVECGIGKVVIKFKN
ncbi:MAG: hypothetical protein IJ455_04315 [Agathobacter sp.]|nr:hypothetical protein [Agathobacter sp.]